MFIFFGTRTSRIDVKPLQSNTECPNCKSQNSFLAGSFGSYFHIFWIPIVPISQKTILQCNHCQETYEAHELPDNIKHVLENDQRVAPPRWPIWHGCGCLIIMLLVFIGLIAGTVGYLIDQVETLEDVREEYLEADLDKTTSEPDIENDSLSYYLKGCINLSIEGIDTDEIRYYTKQNDGKFLILTKVGDMRQIEPSSRKELVHAIEDCMDAILGKDTDTLDVFIGVKGNWNMLMVLTPYYYDLEGEFADETFLYAFYDEPLQRKDTIDYQIQTEDTISNENE